MAETETKTGQLTTGEVTMRVKNSPAKTLSEEFDVLDYLGSGAFSHVFKCEHRQTGQIFACKQLNRSFKNWADPREVYAAEKLKCHPNVVQLLKIHFGKSTGIVSLMYELMDSDLKVLTRGAKSNESLQDNTIRSIMFQILSGISHLHANGIMHCDLKPDNVLLKMPGYVVKLGDMGNVQKINDFLPRAQYYAATRPYRPPECILTFGYYGQEMDIWAAGCIFYELMEHQILFRGKNEVDLMGVIHKILGAPPPLNIIQEYTDHLNREIQYHGPGSPKHQQRIQNVQKMLADLKASQDTLAAGADLMNKDIPQNLFDKIQNIDAKCLLLDMFEYDRKLRPTADAAILHVYFKGQRREE